jgi:hypothetical protein
MLFRSRRVTTAADYLRAMREQQGQKEARFADARSFGVLDLRPDVRSMSGQLVAECCAWVSPLTSLDTCRPTSWRICFGGALR